jgi:predicted MFS family arabinose efflux permease
VSTVFFVHGFVFSSWAARVAVVRAELHLSAGVLGLALAGPGLGALIGSQAGGLLVTRIGSRATSSLTPLLLCGQLALIPTVRSAWALFVAADLLLRAIPTPCEVTCRHPSPGRHSSERSFPVKARPGAATR